MLDRDEARLNRWFQRMERLLPAFAGRFLAWLRKPSSRWVRIPVGVILSVAALFSFLPVLGLWMLPLGLLLLAQDIPALRRWTVRALAWSERRWIISRRRLGRR